MNRKQNQSKALKSEEERLQKLVIFEQQARLKGFKRIAGVDEAGRGPLAGPVVAAACVIRDSLFFPGINDSKLLAPLKRKKLFQELSTHSDVVYAIGIVDVDVIDTINILQASLQAMRSALSGLKELPDYLLVDGNHSCGYVGIVEEKIVKGDRRSQSIAAASILAKETRDAIMIAYHEKYPQYGFDTHKGYGTKQHLQMIEKYGPSPIHRRSFFPCREIL